MKTVIWRQYRFELPDDWEMLQFSRNPESGRCAFADRHRFRFEFNWRVVPGTPDFERILHDYQSRLEEDGLEDVRRLEFPNWHGVRGMQDQRLTTRHGRFFAANQSLVEVVFIWPKEWDKALERRILDSFQFEAPQDDLVRWRAFGMDLRVSATHQLWEATALPTSTILRFTAQKGYREQRFGRFAMPGEWLATTPGRWLHTQLPKGFRVDHESRHERNGHDIFTIKGLRTFPTVSNLFRGRREIKASAWICPEDKRLYSLVLVSTGRVVDLESRMSLRCCEHMEITP